MKLSPRTATAVLAACAALGLSPAAQPAGADAPPPVDKTIPKTALPAAAASLDEKDADLGEAVAYCQHSPDACTFTADRRTYSYYEKARTVGEAYVNCTRGTLERERSVTFRDDAFDSVNQAQDGLFPHRTLAHPKATSAMAEQFERGMESSSGKWTWTRTEKSNVEVDIKPGQASWVEVQPARKRVYGSFRATGPDAPPFQIDVIVDSPAATPSSRVYQRTGPMSSAEKQRCMSDRRAAAARH
ncbi:hypothetical protein [Streptomyces longisporoflavus]|uniref:Uncharacterized protein n=1 Tax=Streptomyces longisporoflavus TaxID=28044 RepID=A0ABW7QVY4_9ACTN